MGLRMGWMHFFKMNINWVLNLVYVPKCVFCEKILPIDTTLCVCEECNNDKVFLRNFIVCKYTRPLDISFGEPICIDCQKGRNRFKGWSVMVYSDRAVDALSRFKYHYKKSYADTFAYWITEKIHADIEVNQIDSVTYVPLHPKRLRERGYHQTLTLAQAVADNLGIPLIHALKKIRHTAPQHRLKKKERLLNLKDAF